MRYAFFHQGKCYTLSHLPLSPGEMEFLSFTLSCRVLVSWSLFTPFCDTYCIFTQYFLFKILFIDLYKKEKDTNGDCEVRGLDFSPGFLYYQPSSKWILFVWFFYVLFNSQFISRNNNIKINKQKVRVVSPTITKNLNFFFPPQLAQKMPVKVKSMPRCVTFFTVC